MCIGLVRLVISAALCTSD